MTKYDLSLQGGCILAAEDDEVNQLVLKYTLAEQHHPYLIVEDGAQAIEAWRELDPVLIIMDITMPIINGIEAIRIIRQEERVTGKRVCIIALTAHARLADEEKILKAGCDHYFSKPINPNTLLDKVAEILDEPKSKRVG